MQTTEYELRDRIDQLVAYRGEGTELITVAVPPDKSLHAVRERIDREYAQAANIKSDQTRTHVQDALGRIRRLLQVYEETPSSGLVIYAGVVDGELQDVVFDDLDVPVDVSLSAVRPNSRQLPSSRRSPRQRCTVWSSSNGAVPPSVASPANASFPAGPSRAK